MNQLTIPMPDDVRKRIIETASELYEKMGKQSFPTVDQVRRTAKVDMNAASSVMRDWRRDQSPQAKPIAVNVPDAIVQANNQALASLWTVAQELANESLRAAQSAWDAERTELDEMRKELADAYESLASEIEQVKAQANDADKAHKESAKLAAKELADVQSELAKALTRAERAEAQVGEIEHRANDLRAELNRSHEEIDQMRIALTRHQNLNASIAAERDEVKSELTKALATAEALANGHQEQRNAAAQELAKQVEQRDQAFQAASAAREHASELVGKLAALQEQNANLLDRLSPKIMQ